MKLCFISDIHGSAFYLEKALARYEKERADMLVLLGDELYHGARNPLPEGYDPKKVVSLLNPLAAKIIAVRGNCDSEVDQMVLSFPIMADYSTLLWQGKRIFLTHGHVFSPDKLPPLSRGDIFIYGHTHVPVARAADGITVINPGSVSLPKENSPRTYGVLEGNIFTIKTLGGEIFKETEI
jgi:putative phosphoesterase